MDKGIKENLFNSNGRLGKKKFLKRILLIEILLFSLTDLIYRCFLLNNFIMFIIQLPFIYSRYTLMCRRLHDSDRSNSQAKVLTILCLIGLFLNTNASIMINFIIIGGEISILLRDGTVGLNAYGNDPLKLTDKSYL
ncbi:DUF805 domain-containing protein [Veillonella montpellierensis]|uniref:DUF805 domain-containing protein n=2 Tax=Veillonella montpellierensis TaxID=187328 RepID=UPI00047F65AD|nr:DUF805 domain-containing protein [Veillonella montpellierensis]